MLKRLAVFPFLFIGYIVLALLFVNLDQIDAAQAARPLGVLFLLSGLSMVALAILWKNSHYAGYVVFLGLAFFFVFGHLNRVVMENLPGLPGWVSLALLGAWGGMIVLLGLRRTWLRFGGAPIITPLLNLALAAALCIQIITHAGSLRQSWLQFASLPASGQDPAVPHPVGDAESAEREGSPDPGIQNSEADSSDLPQTGDAISLDCSRSPDIYYIVLDAYGRADVLESLYGIDQAPFYEYLTQKGFTIAHQSHTNYIQTALSIPSALNMDYLSPEPEGANGAVYFSTLFAENRLVRLLERCNYTTFALKSGFYFTNYMDVDVMLQEESPLSEFESLLLTGTPVDLLSGGQFELLPEQSYASHRRRVLFDFAELQRLPRMAGPKFIFAHIVSPHPPFVFAPNGRPIQPDREYSLGDGDDFDGEWPEYRAGYAGQVHFVNRMLARTINAILARSPSPPVIVIQGDHGPGGFLDWDSPADACLWERTAIFNAYYLPGGVAGWLAPSISPVNSFREILNAYFGTHLEPLPDQTFYTSHRLPRQFFDITAERDSTENCP